jgi:tRNA dimethylallyltransferase
VTADAPRLTVIAGPTASGKTRVALELAEAIGAEIVNADSQQVYRFFDIGTAKPSSTELSCVRHHLISCVDPLEAFSAATFQRLADAAIADIHARGKPVVVVGGTGLYLRVLLHGVVTAPGRDEVLRAELETHSNQALHDRLQTIDPVTAQRLPTSDRVRMIRAIEIHALSGEAASAHRERHAFTNERYPFDLWVLDPPREGLYETINRRTSQMFAAGLVDEVRALLSRGFRDAAPMRAVGYAQALAHVDGTMSIGQAIADVAQKTRHYAKRQWTWFKKEAGARFVKPPYAEILARRPPGGQPS